MALIEIRDIHKRFGEHEVFKGLILEVEEHQVVCLIGPSGCGKSTLLRCINGLETIERGEIRIHGDRDDRARASTSMRCAATSASSSRASTSFPI